AGGSQAVPLPEPRVDLHQLEATVARIAFELDLREAEVAKPLQEPERGVDRLLHPDGFADPAGTDAGRGLPQLPSREHTEWASFPGQVAADRVERVVAAGNELLQHQREVRRPFVGLRELHLVLATERLAPEALLEADGMLRLDQEREAQLLRRRARFLDRAGIGGAGNVDSGSLRLLELHALALHALENVPGGERREHI